MTHQIWLEAGSFSVEAINLEEGGSPDWHVPLWRRAVLIAAAHEKEGSQS